MKIPVFVSCPTHLAEHQAESRTVIVDALDHFRLEPRTLGRTDYPTTFPLREVLQLARHCSGGIVLGFSQFIVERGVSKPGTLEETEQVRPLHLPTPWNQIEAGILFALGLPTLIFVEAGVSGGVFDRGVTDVFIHEMPSRRPSETETNQLAEVISKWQSEVRAVYYR